MVRGSGKFACVSTPSVSVRRAGAELVWRYAQHRYDVTTGERVHSMVAHRAAVSSLSFDPSGLYLVSGGHDRCVLSEPC